MPLFSDFARFDSLRARFLEWMIARNYAARTRPDYDRSIGKFLAWIARNTNAASVSDITLPMLQSYQLTLCLPAENKNNQPEKQLSAFAQCAQLAAIKTFFRWLEESKQIFQNPALAVRLPRRPESLPHDVLSQSEAVSLLEHTTPGKVRDTRDRAILETLYATGIRRAELLGLTIFDVDLRSATLRVEKGKGGRSRLVPLTKSAVAALRLYLTVARKQFVRETSQTYLFVSSRSGNHLSDNDLLRIVRKAAKKAGIKKRVTPHTLRHSCATHLLQERADIRQIQKLLGHKKLSTTEIYTRVEISDLAAVVSRCHPREKQWRQTTRSKRSSPSVV